MDMWRVKRPEEAERVEPTAFAPRTVVKPVPVETPLDRMIDLKVSIHRSLLDRINLSALDKLSREQIQAEIGEIVGELLDAQREPLNSRERTALVLDVLDELLGLGPLEPLL